MAEIGTDKRLVRVRILGVPELIEPQAEKLVDLLEKAGFDVIEWTRPFPCRAPDEDKSRIYISARKEHNSHENQ